VRLAALNLWEISWVDLGGLGTESGIQRISVHLNSLVSHFHLNVIFLHKLGHFAI